MYDKTNFCLPFLIMTFKARWTLALVSWVVMTAGIQDILLHMFDIFGQGSKFNVSVPWTGLIILTIRYFLISTLNRINSQSGILLPQCLESTHTYILDMLCKNKITFGPVFVKTEEFLAN